MLIDLIIAAALAAQPAAPISPPVPAPLHTEYARSGHWQIVRQSVGCAAIVAYRPAADGGQRTLSFAWLANNPDRRLVVLISDTRWREPFDTTRSRYRLLYVGPADGSSPPPVEPLRVISAVDQASGTLAILFDDAAAPAAIASFSRSMGFAVFRGRREISTDRLDGIADALRLVTQCAATFRPGGPGTLPQP